MKNNNEKPMDGEFDGKTFLYIRTHPSDNGTEPLASGLQFWTSPDIILIQPDGTRNNKAISGQINQIEVVITNGGGIDVIDAYVEVFVADPSTAFTPDTAVSIGSSFISVSGNNTTTISFPWVPTSTGHQCLLARVCLSMPPDCYLDGSIFNVANDRHLAQRNIHIIEQTKNKNFSFGFKLTNPVNEYTKFLFKAEEIDINNNSKYLSSIKKALGCKFSQFATKPLRSISLNIGDAFQKKVIAESKLKNFPMGILPELISSQGAKEQSISMNNGEIYYATLSINKNSSVRKGDLHIIEIKQIDLKSEQVVGGLWLIVEA